MIAPADLLQMEWRNPWWGLVALQPIVLALLLRLRRRRLLHYADAHLLPWAIRLGQSGGASAPRRAANALVWLLLAGALAGPRLPLDPVGGAEQQTAAPRHDMDVMVVLDVSPSMHARDVAPDRLSRAKLKLLDLQRRLRGERLGLIVFSGEPGLLMPPTTDTALLGHYLELARTALFEDRGTALAAALRLAQTQLQGRGSKAVLLVTDGETSALSGDAGNAAVAAARALKQADIPMFVLAVGTPQGAIIPLPDGGVAEDNGVAAVSRLDTAGFTALARSSGGKLAPIADDDADLTSLYDHGILALPARAAAAASGRSWRELYPWLLVPALALWAWLQYGNRRAATALAAAALLSGNAQAQPADEHDAYRAYHSRNYLIAQQLYAEQPGYAARMGEGASAYRRRDYGYAVRQFTQALLLAHTPRERADALFNLGNAYYLAGNKTAALDAFQGVLRYRDDDQARANLARVTAQMRSPPGPVDAGIPGRRGRGPSEGQNAGGDTPSRMDEKREKPGVLMEPDAADGARARRDAAEASAAAGTAADLRAARKKLELVRDQTLELSKRLLTQDHGDAASDGTPW